MGKEEREGGQGISRNMCEMGAQLAPTSEKTLDYCAAQQAHF